MAEDETGQTPLGGETPPADPPAATPAGKGDKTRYVVLWALVPEDPDEQPRYREVGRYEYHSAQGARQLAVDDEGSGHHSAIHDAVKQERPIIVRSCPERSWGVTDAEASPVATKVETSLVVP